MQSKHFVSIVEDDESLREALVGLVRSIGHAARGFGSAEEFLAVQDGQCGCVVTDIQMPGISGIEMTQRLRAQGHTTPVIMITARTDQAINDQARASGAMCVLNKPFDSDEFIDCLEKALAA